MADELSKLIEIYGVPELGKRTEQAVTLQRKLTAACAVLADRERELLELKGPCSSDRCRLHYAHSGPCDILEARRG